ncbi:MAG: hypothetical protein ACKVQK_03970 [Burkholderiales bacterium]
MVRAKTVIVSPRLSPMALEQEVLAARFKHWSQSMTDSHTQSSSVELTEEP